MHLSGDIELTLPIEIVYGLFGQFEKCILMGENWFKILNRPWKIDVFSTVPTGFSTSPGAMGHL